MSEGPIATTGVPMKVTAPVHRKLTDIQTEIYQLRERRITYSEVIEMLIASWERNGRQLA